MSSGTWSSSHSPSPTSPPPSAAPPSSSAATPTTGERADLIILAVTSQARPTGVGEAIIEKWKEAGLLRPSVLKPVVATVERGLVLRKVGRLDEEDRAALRKVLDEILGG